MNDFIEAMIKGHDKTEYRWFSGKCRDICSHCDFLNGSVETMQRWQAEGLPGTHKNTDYHTCGDVCSCWLEKV